MDAFPSLTTTEVFLLLTFFVLVLASFDIIPKLRDSVFAFRFLAGAWSMILAFTTFAAYGVFWVFAGFGLLLILWGVMSF